MDKKTTSLKERIDKASAADKIADKVKEDSLNGKDSAMSGKGKAMRAGLDMVSALVVGCFLGYWLDKWLDTKPLFMIMLFFAGAGAGFMNIYRSQMQQTYKVGFKEEPAEDKNLEEVE